MINIEKAICPRCKANNSIIEDCQFGELVCSNCGIVIEENVFEKRSFINDGANNQIHSILLLNNPVYINGISYSISSEIQNLLSLVNIPQNMIEETKRLYNQLVRNRNIQGENINNIIIGIYYYVCRKEKFPKTFKEIVSMFKDIFPNLTETLLKKTFNNIKADIIDPAINDDEINDSNNKDVENVTNHLDELNLDSN